MLVGRLQISPFPSMPPYGELCGRAYRLGKIVALVGYAFSHPSQASSQIPNLRPAHLPPAEPVAPFHILYTSPGFCKLTGYEASEITGKNCKFLQKVTECLRSVHA